MTVAGRIGCNGEANRAAPRQYAALTTLPSRVPRSDRLSEWPLYLIENRRRASSDNLSEPAGSPADVAVGMRIQTTGQDGAHRDSYARAVPLHHRLSRLPAGLFIAADRVKHQAVEEQADLVFQLLLCIDLNGAFSEAAAAREVE